MQVYLVRSGTTGIDARRQLLKAARKFTNLDQGQQQKAYTVVLSPKQSHIVHV
ncbi:hypothetical protein BCR33DRAFT_713304 [Rhizoclosmatium globosum]|uniref:Uncharacterized protein n=1 Tax=Rhizoclosmatium globosum TaxID=329046 RepID=A0A1Y2CTY7_9FUNG|nr:hypothetical protein BCR33DRAFT_713304 [Rhizoclosmatium globosum]|eukprot:ORY50520.1 hypothetical protein BCR33DRAFT_713304 [Rhizoclosmatium globosum]